MAFAAICNQMVHIRIYYGDSYMLSIEEDGKIPALPLNEALFFFEMKPVVETTYNYLTKSPQQLTDFTPLLGSY